MKFHRAWAPFALDPVEVPLRLDHVDAPGKLFTREEIRSLDHIAIVSNDPTHS
jgi:hypothetical protein